MAGLLEAAENCEIEAVVEFISRGVDVNFRDKVKMRT